MSTLETLVKPMAVDPGKPGKQARQRRWTFAQRWLTFLGFVLLWQLVAGIAQSPFFPTPVTIIQAGYQLWFSAPASHLFLTGGVYTDVLPSIGKVLGGWLVATVIGTVIGILVGLSVRAADYTSTVFGFIRAMPPVMLIPVFLVLFKLGLQMQLATIVFGAVWPVLLNAIDGARSVDPTKMDTARSARHRRCGLAPTHPAWLVIPPQGALIRGARQGPCPPPVPATGSARSRGCRSPRYRPTSSGSRTGSADTAPGNRGR